MRTRILMPLLLTVALGAASSHAAQWNPGASLDRGDLQTIYLWGGSSLANGYRAEVKGVKNPSGTSWLNPSWIQGRVVGGDPPRYLYDWRTGSSPSAASSEYTLMPPFVNAVVVHNVASTSTPSGLFVQALLYQPDQVKRSSNDSVRKLLLKQKGSVGFRIGAFKGSDYGTQSFSSFRAPGCKAQANLSRKAKNKATIIKFKVGCGNKNPQDQAVRNALETLFGKKTSGFQLFRDTSKPRP